jgi:hypothetical protein
MIRLDADLLDPRAAALASDDNPEPALHDRGRMSRCDDRHIPGAD